MSDEKHDPMRVGPEHRMDLVSEPGFVVLRRRKDGSVVGRFSAQGATLEEIEKAAEEDRRLLEES